MRTKRCYKCKEEKEASLFHKCRANKDGLNGTCKECKAIQGKAYRKSELGLAASKRAYLKNKLSTLKVTNPSKYKRHLESRYAYEKKAKVCPKRWLQMCYNNMRRRVNLPEYNKNYNTYLMIELQCTKEDFVNWALTETEFESMHKSWVESNYNVKMRPSIDRINPDSHYRIDNLQFLTCSDHTSKDRDFRKNQQILGDK